MAVRFVSTVILTATSSLFAGEKIDFSTPSRKADASPRTREFVKASPNALDTFRHNGFESPTFVAPQPALSNRTPDDRDKKKDWIFATPDDSASRADAPFTAKKDKTNGELKNSLPADKLSPDLKNNDLAPAESAWSHKTAHSTADAARPQWQQPGRMEDRQFSGDAPAGLSDFLKDNRDLERDRYSTHALDRRAQFEQLFQPRTIEASRPVTDGASLSRNPVLSSPDDFTGRGLQNFKDVGALPGARSFSFNDDLNPRLQREHRTFEDKREELRAKPQPAVLPFPQRPGELFKQPGSF